MINGTICFLLLLCFQFFKFQFLILEDIIVFYLRIYPLSNEIYYVDESVGKNKSISSTHRGYVLTLNRKKKIV